MAYQAALSAVKMWIAPRTPGSALRPPSGMYTLSPCGASGTTEPQRPQKQRSSWFEERKRVIASLPATKQKPAARAPMYVANGAACALRHIEQWQCETLKKGT